MNKVKNKPIDDYPIPTKCDYCGNDVVLTSNAEIYGKVYGNGKCYLCRGCRASVGVHYDLKTPLGRLANNELKKLKKQAHDLFDVYWKNGLISRQNCYTKLAEKLNISLKECHFGWFDKAELLKAIEILNNGFLD